MIIIAPDKQPVGTWELEKPFATDSISLEKGDQIYLITDGFADQFGGPRGKKLMYKKVQENIIALAGLQRVFEDWKGDHEQVDDVTLISVRA